MSGEESSCVDLHSHLVPGVDDGAPSLEAALEAVGRMKAAGVRELVTTPHLRGSLTLDADAFRSRMETMDAAWESVRGSVAEEHPELPFHRGHEVMLDVPDVDLSDRRIRLADTSFVLVEWPWLQVPPETSAVLSRIRFSGLQPVIAHPERYRGLDDELRSVGRWREEGAYLQVNHGSLVGRYGRDARRRAFRLLERGWVDYLSSDFHGRPNLELYLGRARDAMAEQGGEEQFGLLARANPGRLLRDEDPLPVPPLELERGFWDRIKELFVPGRR